MKKWQEYILNKVQKHDVKCKCFFCVENKKLAQKYDNVK
jgi:hypothetical protein